MSLKNYTVKIEVEIKANDKHQATKIAEEFKRLGLKHNGYYVDKNMTFYTPQIVEAIVGEPEQFLSEGE